MSLDLSKLERVRERNGKTIARCPVCANASNDQKAEHLFIGTDGGYRCVVGCEPKDIFALAGNRDSLPKSGPCVARPIPKPKRLDLLSRIKRDYPAHAVDLWESSPVKCDESLDDAKAFLRLFPADAVLWIADDVRKTGRPEHTLFFRTRAEWEAETFTAPGTRIAPSAFRQGTVSRKAANVVRHLFTVVESDTLAKDDFCAVLRWLREACGWKLAAVVDSGGKSLHAWFQRPDDRDMATLAEHAAALGLDAKFSEPSQPWRLPGVKRDGSDTPQQLVYLDLGAAL